MPLKSWTGKLNFGAVEISGTWEPDEQEIIAAWKMYVELVTRVSTQPLEEGEGVLREALTSLYTLFGVTREILKEGGATVAQPKGDGELSFGRLAIAVLNEALRPFLTKWHPLLASHEETRPTGVSVADYEVAWPRAAELRDELNQLRVVLDSYADALAEVSGGSALHRQAADG